MDANRFVDPHPKKKFLVPFSLPAWRNLSEKKLKVWWWNSTWLHKCIDAIAPKRGIENAIREWRRWPLQCLRITDRPLRKPFAWRWSRFCLTLTPREKQRQKYTPPIYDCYRLQCQGTLRLQAFGTRILPLSCISASILEIQQASVFRIQQWLSIFTPPCIS